MDKVSVIVPSREERFLDKTIFDIQSKFGEPYEIIVTLDGADANRLSGVNYIYNKDPKGMRTAINQAVSISDGKYILKLDAHCLVDQHIDVKLKSVHHPNWIQTPRRKRLDAHNWEVIHNGPPDIDYMFLDEYLYGRKDNKKNRNEELKRRMIDDTEIFQGSCYFMTKDYFYKLGLLDDKNFGWSGREAQEIAFKCWDDGGRIVVNKHTWYAHAHIGRMYRRDPIQTQKSEEALVRLARSLC